MKRILFITALLLTLGGCKSNTWLGFYYPNGCLECTDDYIYSERFTDSEACLAWAASLKRERGNPNDQYECGLNCESDDGLMYTCEETID